MELYFAPLEGITGYIFRNAYEKWYGGSIAAYYSPFISPHLNCPLTPKERKDILPENNANLRLIPQILANNSEYFKGSYIALKELGYDEINLNLGCPSQTVCSKKKGAGFLSERENLDRFFEDVYTWFPDMTLSVKTRLGVEDPEEFISILDIFNKYPISLLIIHVRVRKDFYNGSPRLEWFDYAVKNSRAELVYNGDIFNVADVEKIPGLCSGRVKGIMLGRGLLSDPLLAFNIKTYSGKTNESEQSLFYGKTNEPSQFPHKDLASGPAKLPYKDLASGSVKPPYKDLASGPVKLPYKDLTGNQRFLSFHDEIYGIYKTSIRPDKHVLFKMKELWTYWQKLFPGQDKGIKKIFKSKNCSEYEIAIRGVIK